MKFFLASDHAGFQMKEFAKEVLAEHGVDFVDLGTSNEDSVDYPDFAHALARKIKADPKARGILVCGSGIGISIAANRHAGVRAARCLTVEDARLARLHNDTNVLALAGRMTEKFVAKEMIETFLDTDFEGDRHENRVKKIEI